jgi:DNA-binding CsgD family transcriptional regulator
MDAPPAMPPATLRGRDGEAALIGEVLGAARDGAGAVLLVEGAAGLGKTRLLDEAMRIARRLGIAAGRGGARPGQAVIPMGPLLSALFDGTEPLLRRADLATVPEQRYWLLQELQELLERRAAGAPVLVVLDDLQWADPGTVEGLRTLASSLAGHPVVWLAALRSGEAPMALLRAADELAAQGARWLRLAPLDPPAVRAIAEDVLCAQPDDELVALAGRAHGNPFLLQELLLGLVEDGLVDVHGGRTELRSARLPRRVARSMRERLEGMSPEARRAAAVAAVLGRSFRFDDLVTMLGTAAAPLLETVEELVRADILAEDADGLRFRHDLICEAVLDTVPAPARRALDRQAAEVLLRAGALPVEIAARLADSAEAGDAVAAQVLHQAARTLAASDLAAACDFSVKALELIADDAPERVPLVKETALLLHLSGRVEAARAFAADALVHALTPAERAEVALATATMFTLPPPLRVEAGESALGLDGVPPALRALHAAILVLNLVAAGEGREALAAERRAAALVAGAGEPAAARTLEMSRLALDEAAARYAAMLERARGVGRLEGSAQDQAVAHALQWFSANALTGLDRLDEALELIGEGIRQARANRHTPAVPRWELSRGRALLQLGRLSDAEAALEGVLLGGIIAVPLPIPPDCAGLLALGRIAIHTGNEQLGQRCAQIARATLAADRSDGRRQLSWLLALQAAAREDAAGVRGAFALLGDLAAESVLPLLVREPCDEPQLVRAALLAGDERLAHEAVDAAERRAAANPGVASIVGAAAHARGLRRGDMAELAAAVEALEEAPRPLALASALEDLGRELVARGDADAGVAALGRALELTARCGATWDARRLRGRLRRLGVRRRIAAAERPEHGWEALTGSEREVVALIASGFTNREAAERLFISPHTVSTHLRHVFAKLGINSRVELARLALQREGAG